MRISSLVSILLLVVIGFATMGCTVTQSHGRERVPWSDGAVDLGQVALMVHIDHHRHERHAEAKDSEVREIVRELMSEFVSAPIDAESVVQNALGDAKEWQHASEHELIEAARKAGVNTLGLVTFERYGGDVWVMLLPPGWATNRYVYYRLRLLDVNTGSVIADLNRYRRTRGYLNVTGSGELPHDLRDDLTQMFAQHQSG